MGIKFDGTNVKNGSRVVANMKRSNELREGSSSGGKALCNIKDGKNIRLGSSSGGRTQIKLSDAAKSIGTSAQGPSTAMVWWFFAR
jgi:hypothetical protein